MGTGYVGRISTEEQDGELHSTETNSSIAQSSSVLRLTSAESLRVKIRGETLEVAWFGVCYTAPDQEEVSGWGFPQRASRSLPTAGSGAPGRFQFPDICWEGNIKLCKQFRKLHQWQFHTKSARGTNQRSWLVVDWLFRSREELAALQQQMADSCSDHKITKFRIQSKARKVNTRFNILDFQSSDLGLFRNCLVEAPKRLPKGESAL